MRIKGIISQGHGVASGKAGDQRYPEGTLRKQLPYFTERGLDLSPYFLGTINLDIAPFSYEILRPKIFIENLVWSEHIPAENFYFFDVRIFKDGKIYEGLIYMPDPTTKVEHQQSQSVLELILPKISGLTYGDTLEIEVYESQLKVYDD